jgi:acetyl esterase/lipase
VERMGLVRSLIGMAVLLAGGLLPGQAWAQESGISLETDIAYVTRGEARLLLDIARPAARGEPRPAVVFLHDWGYLVAGPTVTSMPYRSSSKGDLQAEIRLAAERGYVGVAVGYRLPVPIGGRGAGTQFPGQLYDVKAAIRWLRANAERYGIDPDKVGVVGFGLGGYLALMAALTNPRDGLEGVTDLEAFPSTVQAAVAAGAPVDWLSQMRRTDAVLSAYRAAIAGLLGGYPEEVPDRYARADVTRYFGFSDAPVLAVFAMTDVWVDPEQARLLMDRMAAKAVRHSVLMLPWATPDFNSLASPNSDYPMWSFLDLCLEGT